MSDPLIQPKWSLFIDKAIASPGLKRSLKNEIQSDVLRFQHYGKLKYLILIP